MPRHGVRHSDRLHRGSRELSRDTGLFRARALSGVWVGARVVREGGLGVRKHTAAERAARRWIASVGLTSAMIGEAESNQGIKRLPPSSPTKSCPGSPPARRV